MLTAYPTIEAARALPTGSMGSWIDLLNPTNDERTEVKNKFGLRLPSREELSEVKSSSRLSEKDGTLFLSMPIVANADDLDDDPSPIGFVLSREVLVPFVTRTCALSRK